MTQRENVDKHWLAIAPDDEGGPTFDPADVESYTPNSECRPDPQPAPCVSKYLPCADCGKAVEVASWWHEETPIWCLECYNAQLE